MTQVSDLTIQELQVMIESVVEQRLQAERRLMSFLEKKTDLRTDEEIFASVARNRWTPPPGAKSSLELLREDRER